MIERVLRWGVPLAVAAVTVWFGPSGYCARRADPWLAPDGDAARSLGHGVAAAIDRGVDADRFSTGSARFDGEWVYGTHLMGALGLAQTALDHGLVDREADLARIDRCLDGVVDADGAAFDRDAWGIAALDDPDVDHGHAAWFGYGGLAFAVRGQVAPGGRHAALTDRLMAEIRARLAAAGPGGPETYPGERYPVDQAALVGALGAYARSRGEPVPPEAVAWLAHARARFVDPATGLLIQAVDADGAPIDAPRGSGTFLASYFLSFVDPALSRSLYEAGRRELYGTILRFGMMREYPRGWGGRGDIDSGPVIFGYGISATGFALGAARIHGDTATFRRLYATADLYGAPTITPPSGDDPGELRFATGGPLGDALLLTMLTARAPADLPGAPE